MLPELTVYLMTSPNKLQISRNISRVILVFVGHAVGLKNKQNVVSVLSDVSLSTLANFSYALSLEPVINDSYYHYIL